MKKENRNKADSLFVYTMNQVAACARTWAAIWRMNIIETIVEMVYEVYKSSRSQPTRLNNDEKGISALSHPSYDLSD